MGVYIKNSDVFGESHIFKGYDFFFKFLSFSWKLLHLGGRCGILLFVVGAGMLWYM